MEQNHHNSGHSSNHPQNSHHTPLTTYFFEVTYIFKVCTHAHAQRFTPQITSTEDSTNTTLSNLFYAVHALGRFSVPQNWNRAQLEKIISLQSGNSNTVSGRATSRFVEALQKAARVKSKSGELSKISAYVFRNSSVLSPRLLDDEPEDLKQVREKGKILVQICDSVNEKFQKLGLDIES